MENDKLAKQEQLALEQQEQDKQWIKGAWEYTSALGAIASFILVVLNWSGIKVLFGDKIWIALAFGSLSFYSVRAHRRYSKELKELKKKIPFQVHKNKSSSTVKELINRDGEINPSFSVEVNIRLEIFSHAEVPLKICIKSNHDIKLSNVYGRGHGSNPINIEPKEIARINLTTSIPYDTSFHEERGHYIKPMEKIEIGLRFETNNPQRTVIETIEVDTDALNAQLECLLKEKIAWSVNAKKGELKENLFWVLKKFWTETSTSAEAPL